MKIWDIIGDNMKKETSSINEYEDIIKQIERIEDKNSEILAKINRLHEMLLDNMDEINKIKLELVKCP